MKNIVKHIPNFITSLNIVTGCLACVSALFGAYEWSAYFILLAAVFDFMDGFAARLLKAYSPLGKQLDSLADVISFGVAPAFVLFAFLSQNMGIYWALTAFVIPVFSALRLAKFNIDERQSSSFLGLPTPANALFWAFLIYGANNYFAIMSTDQIRLAKIAVFVLLPLFSFLLVSEIPMFSLKFNSFSLKDNRLRYIFLLSCIVLLAIFQLLAFPLLILLYILLSLLHWAYQAIYVKSSN